MLKEGEFERWIKASHVMFEIFEGRYDAYPLTVRWIEEWFNSKNFLVKKEHVNRISTLFKNFNYAVYRVKGELERRIDRQIKNIIENYLQKGKSENISFAISPYLFTWNFQRFKEYFTRRKDFDLEQYFKDLDTFFKNTREIFENFRKMRLLHNQLDKRKVENIFSEVNNNLREIGIGNNEPIGTIKLLHIFAPYYFPLIDNKIAKVAGLTTPQWRSLTINSFLKWIGSLKSWLQNYFEIIEKLEKELQSSILKLVDEGLYVMSSINLRLRVKMLGLRVG